MKFPIRKSNKELEIRSVVLSVVWGGRATGHAQSHPIPRNKGDQVISRLWKIKEVKEDVIMLEVVYQREEGKHIKKSPNRLSLLNLSHCTEANKPPRDLNDFLLMSNEKWKKLWKYNAMLGYNRILISFPDIH